MTNENPPSSELDEKEPLILTESDDFSTESELVDSSAGSGSGSGSDAENLKREPEEVAIPSVSSSLTSSEPEPRLDQPSTFKRWAFILLIVLLFYFASSLRQSLSKTKKAPNVIYASRYSKEHKFRPAASPIITETLKDGRTRIRGAGPTATPEPKLKPTSSRKSKRSVGSKKMKTRSSKSKVPPTKRAGGRRKPS